jgi:hypothetical protein
VALATLVSLNSQIRLIATHRTAFTDRRTWSQSKQAAHYFGALLERHWCRGLPLDLLLHGQTGLVPWPMRQVQCRLGMEIRTLGFGRGTHIASRFPRIFTSRL